MDDFLVTVERRLFGMEISIFALLDGENYVLFPYGFDYKKAYAQDLGKNCDGMGSIAPHPHASPEMDQIVHEEIMIARSG